MVTIRANETLAMFETTFRNLDDTLRTDAGCSCELDTTIHIANRTGKFDWDEKK